MITRTSTKGLCHLISEEGVVPAPYWDTAIPPELTYGVGHTRFAGPPDPAQLPKAMPTDLDTALVECFALFARDIRRYEEVVTRGCRDLGIHPKQHEFDASVSFCYNTGEFANAWWVKSWAAGNMSAAEEQFMNWCRPPSISDRREREQRLWATGVYPHRDTAVYKTNGAGELLNRIAVLTPTQVAALLEQHQDHTAPPEAPPTELADRIAALEEAVFGKAVK